jgi:hypothetical protein
MITIQKVASNVQSVPHQSPDIIHSIITNTKYRAINNRPIECVSTNSTNSTPQLSKHFIYRQDSINLTIVVLSGCTLFIYLIYS